MPTLRTARLELTPLAVADAEAMVDVLGDPALYVHTGGEPPDAGELERRYRVQCAGPGNESERWLNWILRLAPGREPVGYVQATVAAAGADVAWVIGTAWQGSGYAREAAAAMCDHLRADGVRRIVAYIRPGHVASERVAAAIGLAATAELDDEGEQRWSDTSSDL